MLLSPQEMPAKREAVKPTATQSRRAMYMIFQGWSMSVFQA